MTHIKTLVFNHFKTLFTILGITTLSLFLLMIRLKLTHSFFLLFLVWNLFLAFIPFAITFYLKNTTKLSGGKLGFWFFIWLLFLPNAPYIVTDLIHLQLSEGLLILLDILVIGLFALSGLYCYFMTVRDMKELVSKFLSERIVTFLFIITPFLCGFGIYLGRVLRFNSWDLLNNPVLLLSEIIHCIIHPIEHWAAWTITVGFGVFLTIVSKPKIK
ncbi:DUF1361 domain-containing protein [Jejudonia soesokkakensis]|uniref:DUF1361 domain-containing protein n=1 Tax=Jejudonia soesokkakensis TaxID=1323432 RepID=A0ABW2MWN5_9FLAO